MTRSALLNDNDLAELSHPEHYMFSREYGSLFEDSLVYGFLPWLEETAWKLPQLFGTEQLYPELERLPEARADTLAVLSHLQLHHVAKVLGHLVSAYLLNHCHGEPLRQELRTIPQNLARPFVFVSQKLGMPPILSYKHYCQGNWRLKDPRDGFTIENLELTQHFVDQKKVPDESGFILVHTAIEHRGRGVPFAVGRCAEAMRAGDHLTVESSLWEISGALDQMYAEMLKMPLWCNPAVYYKEVRPQIQLFKNVVYEGCGDFLFTNPFPIDFSKPVTLRGETGAQTPLIALIIAFLDILETPSPLIAHTRDMRSYMLQEQRAFVELVERTPSVREYVHRHRTTRPDLRAAYNACLEGLRRFLKLHYSYAMEYVHKQGQGPTGTGGTPYKEWLNVHLTDVRNGKI